MFKRVSEEVVGFSSLLGSVLVSDWCCSLLVQKLWQATVGFCYGLSMPRLLDFSAMVLGSNCYCRLLVSAVMVGQSWYFCYDLSVLRLGLVVGSL